MIRFKNNNRDDAKSASLHLSRDSDTSLMDDGNNNSDIVERRQEKIHRHLKSRSLDSRRSTKTLTPSSSQHGATLKPFFPAALVSNLTKNSLEILECTLTMRQSATHVTRLNTRLIESMAGGEMAFMSRMLAMGASPNATCRLNHISVCHLAAMQNTDVLELLLKHGADVSRADKEGRTPLHFAAWEGNAKQIALILNFPEDLRKRIVNCVPLSSELVGQIRYHSTPVHPLTNMACNPNVEKTLDVNWSDGMEHNCRNIKDMLPPFQNEKTKHGWCHGWTALHAACARAQHHCVELLIAAGANVNAQDALYRTPLDVVGYAYYMGHKIEEKDFKSTINLLLTSGKQIQKRRCSLSFNSIDTPLHTAVELESEASVEQLLLSGASATGWNSEGSTAMHICVKRRNKELLQLLADFKYSNEDPYLATIDVKNKQGFTVLYAAIKEGWTQGVCIALGAKASIILKANGDSAIHIAAQVGNIDILQQIVAIAKLTNTLDFRNEKGETALFKAISHNQLHVLKILLSSGSNIELKTAMDTNVFHLAAKHGNEDILEYLLEYNPQVTARLINKFDNLGPPLFYAVSNNHTVCAELLISKGAQEIVFVKMKSKRYLICWETWLKIGYITLAVFLPRIVSWETKTSPEWARLVATFALLFSWFEMMFLLSRFPDWGYYVLMFGKVASKVLKILLSFVFLVFGFSVSFMIHFHAKPPFEGPMGAFVTTLVMMTSEFDYNDSLRAPILTNVSITAATNYGRALHKFGVLSQMYIKEVNPLEEIMILRIHTKKNEIMMAPDNEFNIIVIQHARTRLKLKDKKGKDKTK
ncbi:unnamed protein product [Spodoptera exigua]|nr:unnamed protein product [Spodoptera exigua]